MAPENDSPEENSRAQADSAAPRGSGLKRQFFWSMAPLLVVTALNLVSAPLFVRYLGTDLYALWFYVGTITGAFGFMDLGLGVAAGRYIGVALGAGDQRAVREYWGTANLIAIPLLLAMAGVFTAIGIFLGPRWFNVSPGNVRLLQWSFVGGGVGLFLSYYTQFWLVLSQAHLDFKFIGLLRSGLSLLQVPLAVWLAYATRNPLVLILVGGGFYLLQLAFFIWHAGKHYRLGMNFSDAQMARAREMSGYVTKTFGALMAGSFLGSLDRLILGKLGTSAEFSYYTVATNFGSRIQGLSQSIMGPVFHQTSRAVGRNSRASAAAIYNETFDFTFGWYVLASVWAVCWHPIFLRLWLGADLAPGVAPVFAPLVVAFCLSAIASISSAQLGPLNRMGVELGFTIAGGLIRGAFALAGWYWGGLVGLVWGVLLSRVVTFVQDVYVIRMVGGGAWLAAKTWGHLLAQCLVGAGFATAYLFFPRDSFWLVVPAGLHGIGVAAWLARKYVKRGVAYFLDIPMMRTALRQK